jgi:hypothetical protein
MTLQEAYIHLQQGLQNIAAFVGRDWETWELDWLWYSGTNKFIRLVFPDREDLRENERYSDIQTSLDNLRAITVVNHQITPLTESTINGYTLFTGSLPKPTNNPNFLQPSYRHLLNSRSIVLLIGCKNGEEQTIPNRLVEQDELYNQLENPIYKTVSESPISSIYGDTITVFASYKGKKLFNVKQLFIDYIKQPIKYEYSSNDTNINASAQIEFPEEVVFQIIKTTLIYASVLAEQNPNKIQLIAQQT